MTISVLFKDSGVRAGRAGLGRFATAVAETALAALGKEQAEVSILFCSPAEIHRLNREYLDEDRPTDVLSFPSEEEPYLGDLAICLPYVARAAATSGRPLDREIALMVVHGILHLVGRDHDNAERKKRMWREQDTILAECDLALMPGNLDLRGME